MSRSNKLLLLIVLAVVAAVTVYDVASGDYAKDQAARRRGTTQTTYSFEHQMAELESVKKCVAWMTGADGSANHVPELKAWELCNW